MFEFLISPVLRAIFHTERRIMASIDTLTTEVSEAKTAMASATTLIQGLKTRLDEAIAKLEAGDNGEALDALSQELDTSSNALAQAVAANTPAATEQPVEQPTQPDTGFQS